jgi:hypothetical protein
MGCAQGRIHVREAACTFTAWLLASHVAVHDLCAAVTYNLRPRSDAHCHRRPVLLRPVLGERVGDLDPRPALLGLRPADEGELHGVRATSNAWEERHGRASRFVRAGGARRRAIKVTRVQLTPIRRHPLFTFGNLQMFAIIIQ